jgi:hypothetical protein
MIVDRSPRWRERRCWLLGAMSIGRGTLFVAVIDTHRQASSFVKAIAARDRDPSSGEHLLAVAA